MDIQTTILQELRFNTYRAQVRVVYKENVGIQEIAELIRGSAGVTTVATASHSERTRYAVFIIKLITRYDAKTAFKKLKSRILRKIPVIFKFDVDFNTLERLQ